MGMFARRTIGVTDPDLSEFIATVQTEAQSVQERLNNLKTEHSAQRSEKLGILYSLWLSETGNHGKTPESERQKIFILAKIKILENFLNGVAALIKEERGKIESSRP